MDRLPEFMDCFSAKTVTYCLPAIMDWLWAIMDHCPFGLGAVPVLYMRSSQDHHEKRWRVSSFRQSEQRYLLCSRELWHGWVRSGWSGADASAACGIVPDNILDRNSAAFLGNARTFCFCQWSQWGPRPGHAPFDDFTK